MSKKKVIGIYADSIDGEMKQKTPYLNFISYFGNPRLINQYDSPKSVVEECDALLIPGGADVNPMRYGEIPHPATGRCNIHYEFLDKIILPEFVAAKKPIIGICRGFQTLNVHFGGTLFQDIRGHNQTGSGFGSRTTTKHDLVDNKGVIHKINTIHHQAAKKLGEGLKPIGFSPVIENCSSLQEKEFLYTKKYNKRTLWSFVEVFEHEELPILGFQYHPKPLGLC